VLATMLLPNWLDRLASSRAWQGQMTPERASPMLKAICSSRRRVIPARMAVSMHAAGTGRSLYQETGRRASRPRHSVSLSC
jgi:hypothetical protein